MSLKKNDYDDYIIIVKCLNDHTEQLVNGKLIINYT